VPIHWQLPCPRHHEAGAREALDGLQTGHDQNELSCPTPGRRSRGRDSRLRWAPGGEYYKTMDFPYVVVPALIVLIGILIAWLSMRRVLSLRGKSYPRWRTITERIVLSLVALTAVAVAGSSGWNAIALYRLRNPPPGETYLVNGHQMRIHCTGSGSPTIVLDAGLGNDGLIWGGVQPVLAKTTRVCSYDRAGFGWSDALPPTRDADHIAAELHELLATAKINGPIVLMGHSIAGIYIRDYATRYPANLSGLIFVDGSTPLQNRNPAFKAQDTKGPPRWFEMLLNRAAFAVGIPRLIGGCSRSFPGFDARAARLLGEDRCHEPFAAIAGEMESFDRSGEETVHSGPYDALPILIFSQDPAKALSDGEPADVSRAWNQMQENLKKLSTRSRRIIAKGSGHYIQLNRAELIEREVPLFIEQIRGTAPEPTDYGSTKME
jgi:pimeloyl-ACP methyl ester carboxylesterase